MINLLPSDLKEQYVYARRNAHLRKWIIAFAAVIAGAVILTAAGWLYLDYMGNEYTKQIAVTEKSLDSQNYTQVQKDVKTMSNNLELAVQVLSKQMLFSELLTRLGSLMPKDTRLTTLSVADSQGAIDITAKAKTYDAATQVPVNLTGSEPKVFAKADIVSITCVANPTDGYPCTVSIRALFVANNPFLFINDSAAKAAST